MANDKKTIGVTSANAAILADLLSQGHFASEIDAAKFAMAYAVRQGVKPGTTDGAGTKWNVGSVDPDGSLRAVVEILFPEDRGEPYRLFEHLLNEGLSKLREMSSAAPPDVFGLIFSGEANR